MLSAFLYAGVECCNSCVGCLSIDSAKEYFKCSNVINEYKLIDYSCNLFTSFFAPGDELAIILLGTILGAFVAVLFLTSLILWCLLLREKKRHAYQPIGEEGRRCGGGACLFCCIGGCDCRNGGGDGGGGDDDEDEGGDGDGVANRSLELAQRNN